MNLQKELVSQELLIDKRLTSGEHKKVVPRNSSGIPIPSTATGAKDGQLMVFPKEQTPRSECVPRKRLADWKDWKEDNNFTTIVNPKYFSKEKKSKVEDGNKLEHSSATDANNEETPRSECLSDARDEEPPRSERSSDRKDSSKENAYLSEDTIKLEPLLATDVDIILDEDQEPAICEPQKGRTSRRKTDVWEEAKAFRNHSRGSYNLNLKTVVDDKLPVAKVVPMPPSPPDPPNPNI